MAESICPKCGERVLYVHNLQDALCTYELTPDGKYSEPEIETTDGLNTFQTPCGCVEFDSEEDALAFLRNEVKKE
jgi:hypothetical protein